MRATLLKFGVFWAIVALVLTGAPPAALAVAGEDTSGPELVSVERVGSEVITRHGDWTSLDIEAVDPSGVRAVDAVIRRDGPPTLSGGCGSYISGWFVQETGTWKLSLCGLYSSNLGPSTVVVEKLILTDSWDNVTEVTDRAVLDPLSYRIENPNYDGDVPVLESITVEPAVAVPGEDITVKMRVREESSILQTDYELARRVLSPSDGPGLDPQYSEERVNGDGTHTIVHRYNTDDATPYGDYPLGDIWLYDYRDNFTTVDSGAAIRIQDPAHPVGATHIMGETVVGKTLNAHSSWPDTAATLEYAWARSRYETASPTGTAFRLLPEHAGGIIVLQVKATWPDGTIRHRTVLSDPVRPGSLGIGTVSIHGTGAVGSTLTAGHRQIDPASHPSPVAAYHAYTWLRDGQQIENEGAKTYTPAAADRGHKVSVRVRSQAPGYASETTESAAVIIAAGTLKAPTPAISGEAGVGSLFAASAGAWTSGTTLKYQWLRNEQPITGATAKTYTSVKADLNQVLQVRVAGSKAGYTTVIRISPSQRPVTGRLSTTTPRIDGTMRVGKRVTATLPYAWTPGTVFKYQWQRNGRNITAATGRIYALSAADRGQQIRIRVTGSQTGYTTATRYSAVRKPGYGILSNTSPSLSGTQRVGYRMTVNPGIWTSGTALIYQWLRNGTRISGATARTYTLRSADRGKAVSVLVTGTKPGYLTVTNESRTFRVR
ncbi:hypothetical protein [Arthrobacter monumenti]